MQKWRISVDVAKENLFNLEGDCLLAAAMICYLAPFTQNKRIEMFQTWVHKLGKSPIYHTKNMQFNTYYSDPILIKQWLDNGLPNDSLSIENAIILDLSIYQPILIDP